MTQVCMSLQHMTLSEIKKKKGTNIDFISSGVLYLAVERLELLPHLFAFKCPVFDLGLINKYIS